MEVPINIKQTRLECQRLADAYFKILPNQNSANANIANVSLKSDTASTIRHWEKMIEADTRYRKTRDAFNLLPFYFKDKDGYKEIELVKVGGKNRDLPPPPKTIQNDWLMTLQNIELSLASEAAQKHSFELYNRELYKILGELWSPKNEIIDRTETATAPILYFLTRTRSIQRRHSLLKPNEERIFKIGETDIVGNFFPIGITKESAFLFFGSKKEHYETLPIVPILTGLSPDESSGYYKVTNSRRSAEHYASERIDNRINILNQQVIAAKYALRRHLGYWEKTNNMYDFVYNYFDYKGFTSLLEVASNSLRQIRILSDVDSGNIFLELPSLEIINVSFNNNESIWYNLNNIRVTQKTNKYHSNKCVDPIIDFQVINYCQTPCIISRLLFRHYGTWSVEKAQPLYGVLESAQTINIEIDFDDSINTYELDPPIYLLPNSPGRFKLRLVNFVKNCPGTDTLIQFGLICNNNVCDTPIFHMDIRGFITKESTNDGKNNPNSDFIAETFYEVKNPGRDGQNSGASIPKANSGASIPIYKNNSAFTDTSPSQAMMPLFIK